MQVMIEPMPDAAAKAAAVRGDRSRAADVVRPAGIERPLCRRHGRPPRVYGRRRRHPLQARSRSEYQFGTTCNIWWLGVRPASHRRGLGRALIERAAHEARRRGCRRLAVETMSPRAESPGIRPDRAFYAAMGFEPFVEFEPEPGDWMMWMVRAL
jgi:GNAT superfamily N-acetyltransferase